MNFLQKRDKKFVFFKKIYYLCTLILENNDKINAHLDQMKSEMNQIYGLPIEKAGTLVKGLKNHRAFLQQKGYDTSIIEQLEHDAAELEREAKAMAIEEAALASHRAKCHAILDRLKTDITTGKNGIKNIFEMSEWPLYGVTDRR